MPTTKQATLSANPAQFTEYEGGVVMTQVTYSLRFGPKGLKHIEFTTLNDLVKQMAEFGNSFDGEGVSVYVRLPRGARKPPGFDSAVKANEFYNVKTVKKA